MCRLFGLCIHDDNSLICESQKHKVYLEFSLLSPNPLYIGREESEINAENSNCCNMAFCLPGSQDHYVKCYMALFLYLSMTNCQQILIAFRDCIVFVLIHMQVSLSPRWKKTFMSNPISQMHCSQITAWVYFMPTIRGFKCSYYDGSTWPRTVGDTGFFVLKVCNQCYSRSRKYELHHDKYTA